MATSVEAQLQAIQAQLDTIQADLAVRNRRLAELDELKDDLTVIFTDVFQAAIVELDDVTPFLKTGDLTSLVKKLLRNTNRISATLSKLESAADFVADSKPISHDLFHRFILKLDELEHKGYFQLAADLQVALDALVQTLAGKKVLPALGSALESVNSLEAEQVQHFSLWKMYRASKTPEMRQLMGLAMSFVQVMAREMNPKQLKATNA